MNSRDTPDTPIACTLGAGAFEERLTQIAELNRFALKCIRREGERLTLVYDPRAAARVREMVRRERECCAFLKFRLNEDANGPVLVITAPESARDVLDAIFDPFGTGSKSCDAGCACTTAGQ